MSGSSWPAAARATLCAGRVGRRRLGLRAVREHPQQQQPLDTLRAQEVRGVAVLFLQEKDQQASTLDVFRARRHGVHHRLLNHAVEAERRLRFDDRRRRYRSECAGKHVRQLPAQHVEVRTTVRQHAPRLRLVRDRKEQVLEPDLLMTTVGCHAEGSLDRLERLGRKRHRCLTHVRVRRQAPS